MSTRTPYQTDVSDEEWTFVAPYVTVLPEDVAQRTYALREVFNGVRSIVKRGAHWRLMPHDLPPWPLVESAAAPLDGRWMAAGWPRAALKPSCTICASCCAAPRSAQRHRAPSATERPAPPSAAILAILDARPIQSTPESGARAGYDGHKRRNGSKVQKVPVAVETRGHLLALLVTPAAEQERAPVEELAQGVQAVTGEHVELAYVDQGSTGEEPATAAADHGIQLAVGKLREAKRGFVLLPRRWVVERDFAWAARFRRLARDYERLATTLASLHFLAFACLLLHRFISLTLSP